MVMLGPRLADRDLVLGPFPRRLLHAIDRGLRAGKPADGLVPAAIRLMQIAPRSLRLPPGRQRAGSPVIYPAGALAVIDTGGDPALIVLTTAERAVKNAERYAGLAGAATGRSETAGSARQASSAASRSS